MTDTTKSDHSPWAVFLIFLRLGLTSFGGPIAHLGYFHDEFVTRRQWLTERSYADLVALCQFLPGPASSQVGIAIGLSRSGYAGALAAWAGFTLPSAIALILFALGMANYGDAMPAGVLHGLKVVAVAVVAQAVWGMARNLCPDAPRITVMAAATCFVLLVPSAWGQVGVIAIAGGIGLLLFKPQQGAAHDPLPIAMRRRVGLFWLTLFFALLIGLPLLQPCSRIRRWLWSMPSTGPDHWSLVAGMSCCRCCKPRSCLPAGSAMMHFWQATVPRRPSLVLCSPSRRFSALR